MKPMIERTETEELIKILGDNSPIGVCIIQEGKFCYINPAFLLFTGYSADELEGRDASDIVVPEDREMVREDTIKMLKGEHSFPSQFRVACEDGSTRWVMETVTSIQYHGRRATLEYYMDITERKQAEDALRESEQNLIRGQEIGQMGYWKLNPVTQNVEASDELLEIFELGRDELTLDAFANVVHPEDREYDLEHIQRGMEEGVPWDIEHRLLLKNGSIKWIRAIGEPNLDENGKVTDVMGIVQDITERKQTEEGIRVFSNAIASSINAVAIADLEGNLTHVNKSFLRMWGYDDEKEILGKNAMELWQVTEEAVEVMQKALNKDGGVGELVGKRKDGSIFDVLLSASVVRDEAGRPICRSGSFIDVTERKRAEEGLKQSRQILESVLESAPDGVYLMNLKGTFLYGNQKAEEIVGYSRNELIDHSFLDLSLLPEEQLEKAAELLECNIRGQSTGPDELQLIRKNSTRVWTEISTSVIQRGEETVVIGFVRDITERKQAEEALQQSEENYKTLFDSEVVGTIVIDAETMKVVTGNQAAVRTFGFSSVEEAIGVNPLDFIPPGERHRVLKIIVKDMFEQDLRQTHEFRVMTKDGREIWINGGGARIMHQGKLMGLISFTDVTKQKRQSEQLMLTDRLASIGELAAGAAHELNNPLTTVIGFSQLLMEKDIPDDIRQDLALIHSEAQRAAGVTKNLLAFARKHKPAKDPNQINSIIEDVLKLRTYEHKIKDIEVEKQLASDLPESMVDYFQMQQVFFNIVINAEYFMTEAHDRGTLTITTEKQDGTVRISFADDGLGIPPENLSQIFNPFFTTKATGKGTGLGLSICHGVVSEHGGQIYARSQPGEGTTISIELPINGRR